MGDLETSDRDLQQRDRTAERLEREAYDVLLHVFTLCGASPDVECAELLLARDLAFEGSHLSLLIDHLVMSGCVRRRVGGGLFITSTGSDYIEHAARNRRSVRHRSEGPRAAPGLNRWRESRIDS